MCVKSPLVLYFLLFARLLCERCLWLRRDKSPKAASKTTAATLTTGRGQFEKSKSHLCPEIYVIKNSIWSPQTMKHWSGKIIWIMCKTWCGLLNTCCVAVPKYTPKTRSETHSWKINFCTRLCTCLYYRAHRGYFHMHLPRHLLGDGWQFKG